MYVEVTFSCGHTGEIEVYGDKRNRERLIWVAEHRGLCEECEKKAEAEKAEAIARFNEENNLPELKGSEKQIAWANSIRKAFAEEVNAVIERHLESGISEEEKVAITKTAGYILANENAKFFIDEITTDVYGCMRIVYRKHKDEIDAVTSEKVEPETVTLKPEEVTEGTVEIEVSEEKASFKYHKDDKFMAVVKKHGCKWDGICWRFVNGKTTGNIIDRAAEIGADLIEHGFSATVSPELAGKIKNGYEPMFPRWINVKEYHGEQYFYIIDRNKEGIESKAESLGSKSSYYGLLIPIKCFREVLDLASVYDMRISDYAQKFIDTEIEKLSKAETVKPTKVEKVGNTDGLSGILESSSEVLDDLKDEN